MRYLIQLQSGIIASLAHEHLAVLLVIKVNHDRWHLLVFDLRNEVRLQPVKN